jgi:hypothetical protein
MKRLSCFVILLFLSLWSWNLYAKENSFMLFQLNSGSQNTTSSQSAFNPLISVIGDILFFNSDLDNSIFENGLDIRELEISFSANVDTFARADFFFGIHRESEEDTAHAEESPHAAHYAMHLEEGYITFLTLPASFQIKVGKMLAAVGKANPNHLHNLNWYDYPAAIQTYFGDDGLGGTGFEVNFLPPLPYYSELKYQLLHDETGAYFSSHDNAEWFHNFQLKNFFELGEDHSLEIDLGYLFVPSTTENDYDKKTDALEAGLAADEDESDNGGAMVDVTHSVTNIAVYYVWQPVERAREKKLTISAELFLFSSDLDSLKSSKAGYAALDFKFDIKWAAGFRWDYVEQPYEPDIKENQYTADLTYIQSEYAFIRGGYTYIAREDSNENRIFVQLNFGIGPHRAHSF